MKTVRTLIALSMLGLMAVAPVLKSQAQIVAPMPDLVITKITEAGMTTKVTVKNSGTGNSAGSYLRCYYWNGASWQPYKTVWVGPLAVGVSTVMSITDAKVGAQLNKYSIDFYNTVVESKENNNDGYFPPPAG